MTDKREGNLPKWAKEILAQERTKSALNWPDERRPEPLWTPGANVYAPADMDGRVVWQSNPSLETPERKAVSRCFIVSPSGGGFGSRPEGGRFFATEREAALDMWWAKAERAARSLYDARAIFQACDD